MNYTTVAYAQFQDEGYFFAAPSHSYGVDLEGGEEGGVVAAVCYAHTEIDSSVQLSRFSSDCIRAAKVIMILLIIPFSNNQIYVFSA